MREALGPRLPLLALVGVLAWSTTVVVVAFNPVPHPGGDNAGYLSLAHDLFANGRYTDVFDPEGLPHTKYPPFFPLVLAGLMALGARGWIAFKSVAAISTVATVGATQLWATRRLGVLGGSAVALLVATAAAVVYYSHWVLSDPLFLALTIGGLAALERAEEETGGDLDVRWLALGVTATLLAYLTRSAGLPLAVALLAWLASRRRWRPAAASALALALPALAWWWRGRSASVASYAEEFWMVDPYQPALGTVGVLGLGPRLASNLRAYLLDHGPGGLVGGEAGWVPVLGVAVTAAAVAGWVLRARKGVGPTELFFPMYGGLILLWPEVWAGDRFALPLYPVMLLYAAEALRASSNRLPSTARTTVGAVAFAVVFLPAGRHAFVESRVTAECAAYARSAGPYACYGPGVAGFVAAAVWSGEALPDDAAVLSRKPRHFYLLSGRPSRAFPFTDDAEDHLELADRLGARYVLLDQWDGLAGRYVGGAVRNRPHGFCYLRAFGDPRAGGAQLLGVRGPEEQPAGGGAEDEAVQVAGCPTSYQARTVDDGYVSSASASWEIPLLSRPGA